MILLLSTAITLPITSVTASPTTYVSAINPSTGNTYFNYTDVDPPPTALGYPLGYVLVNLTVTNVNLLRSWQVNLTWDPTLLEIAVVGTDWNEGDMYAPSDHVFKYDSAPSWFDKTVDNAKGTLFWGVALHSTKIPGFNGSGTMFCVKFNITQVPPPTRTCNLTIVRTGFIVTKLITTGSVLIPFTENNGYYEYKITPPPPPPSEGASLNVEPPEIINSSIIFPQTIQINITVKNITGMYGYEFSLGFDPSILVCINLTVLDVLGETNYTPRFAINNYTGVIEVNVTYYPPAVPITSVPEVALVTLIFRVKGLGVSVLDLYDTNLTDQLRRPIPHDVNDGLFVNLIRDLAVTDVAASRTWAYQGQPISVKVKVRNDGEIVETFVSVSAYYDSNLIGSTIIASLNPSEEKTLSFDWDTTSTPPNDYAMSAEVVPVPYESDLGDNTFVDGNVTIVQLPPPPNVGGASLNVQPPEIIDPSKLPPLTVQYDITIKNVTDMYGYEFKLSFNQSILTCISLTVLDALGETNYIPEFSINNTGGVIWVNVTYFSPAVPITTVDEVALVRVRFRVKGKGISVLDLYDTNLVDQLGRLIPHTLHDGLFSNLIDDLAVTNVVPSKVLAYQGQIVFVNVTVQNQGEMVETFVSVNAYYDSNLIGSTIIASLNPSESKIITFDWDTSSTSLGDYTISAEVVPVPYESDLGDNTFVDGNVTIASPPPPVGGASLNVQPPEIVDPSIAPPQTVQYNITVKNVTGMYDYQFSLSFNPDVLVCISVTILDAQGETHYISEFSFDNTIGIIKVNVTYYPPAVPITSVPEIALVKLVFRVKSRGVSVLDLHDTNLSDELGRSMPHDVNDGLFKSLVRDLAVTNVVPERNWAYKGQVLKINVTVQNVGEMVETSISVKAYYDSNLIATKTISSLNPSQQTNITFNWNTASVTPCHNYIIKAEVVPVPFELNLTNNNFTDGTVKIKILGDLNADGIVDGQDVILIIEAIPSYPGHPRWNPQADLSNDGIVDGVDIVLCLQNMLKSCT